MNFLKLFTIFSLLIVFSACSKDEKSVIGNWEPVKLVVSNCDDPEDNSNLNLVNGCFTEEAPGFEVNICITLTLTDKDFTFLTVTKFLGESETETFTGTYKISGNDITFKGIDGSIVKGTTNSSKTELTVVDEDDEDGCVSTISFKKK